jgi:hypothetical protein
MKEEKEEIAIYKSYQTKSGNDVRIYATCCDNLKRVHGAIERKNFNDWYIYQWDKFGKCILGIKHNDLVLKSE